MLVQTQPDLVALCRRLSAAPVICIDTEFASEGRYYADLGTIQIAAGDDLALVDPIALRDLSPLREPLTSSRTVKVLHAGEQDLDIFARLFGQPIAPIFDTQIAAAFLGFGDQISLRNLVLELTGARMEKGSAFTDWLRRPLSDSQVEYALNDVRYLQRVYDAIVERLRTTGRTAWVEEEFRSQERPEHFVEPDPRQMYRKIAGADRLSAAALGVLQELAAWREETARRANIPPQRIAIDPVLLELARRPRASLSELAGVRGLNQRQVEKFGAGLLQAMRAGANNRAAAIFRPDPFPDELEPTLDFLWLCLRAVAREKSISTGVLANRSDLRAFLTAKSEDHIPLLHGWRREVAGDALLRALRGELVVSVLPGTREVRLEWEK